MGGTGRQVPAETPHLRGLDRAGPGVDHAGSPRTANLLLPRLHQAIGIVNHPDGERSGGPADGSSSALDACLYLHTTQALGLLHQMQRRKEGEVPEIHPSGK